MMERGYRSVLTAALVLALTPGAGAREPGPARPTRPGTCVFTAVKSVGYRLEDGRTGKPMPNSGSVVAYANGILGISYDQVEAVDRSRAGDRVMLCLASLPRHCPPGDTRGRIYTATNLRTQSSWTLPDSQHSCGGA